jgi:AcrR family transcriptional regulator
MATSVGQADGSREQRRTAADKVMRALLPMLERGERYTKLSVEHIAREAGISRTTFYVYFEDKGDLLVKLAEDIMDSVQEAADRWWSLPPGASRAQVYEALRGVIDVYATHGPVMQAVVELAAYDDRVRSSFRRSLEESRRGLRSHIERGLEGGWVRSGVDAQRTTEWLLWMSERGFYQLIRPVGSDRQELDRLADSLTSVVWYALYETTPGRET